MPESKRRKPRHTGPTRKKIVLMNQEPEAIGGVLIAYMHGGNVRGEFAGSLFNTARAFPQHIIGQVTRQSGPRVATTRNNLMREVLLTNAEWVLCIDTDQYWLPSDLKKLFEAADPVKAPIVGGLVFADQGGQLFPTLYKMGDEGNFHVALDYPRDTLVNVDGTGAAFLLIHRRVLERMKDAYPKPHHWFQETVVNERDRGEDLEFCTRARALGYKILVHTGVRVGHVKTRYLTEEEYDRSNEAGHFLITGTGRSGTGFAAALLSRMLIPCGHEQVFKPGVPVDEPATWDAFRGEASWLAAPHMPVDYPTVQLVRNPLETLRSLVGIGFLARTNNGHKPYEDFAFETLGSTNFMPTDDKDEIIRRCVDFMYEWSAIIEAHDVPRFRVEDLSDLDVAGDFVFELLGKRTDRAKVQQAIDEVDTDVNTRRRDEDITWEDGGERLIELAERWGYATS